MLKISTFSLEETCFLANSYPYREDGGFYAHPVQVCYEGLTFDCVECAFQAAKTLNLKLRQELQAMTPFAAIKLAAAGRLKEREDWDEIKIAVMTDLVSQKFSGSAALTELLLATGDAVLENGNHSGDCFWGVCAGMGQNHLGKILMQLRSHLRAGI